MAFPPNLREAIERELAGVDRSRVARAAEQITSDYKAGNFSRSLASAEARAAYLITRLPATYAACEHVFRKTARLVPSFTPLSLLDLGAGPGTASWAASEVWASLREFTLIEANRDFADIGRRFAESLPQPRQISWDTCNLSLKSIFPAADVAVLSYVIGEFPDSQHLLSLAWNATKQLLVLIEPGTPSNFKRMIHLRKELIASGANILAPCPHTLECPMAAVNDWCHFSVRLERTSEHRRMKGGALGYEDEKFSYLAFAKNFQAHAGARIIRHPMTHSGYIRLSLCTSSGLEQQTVTRSQKEDFRTARRAKWGDQWPQLE